MNGAGALMSRALQIEENVVATGDLLVVRVPTLVVHVPTGHGRLLVHDQGSGRMPRKQGQSRGPREGSMSDGLINPPWQRPAELEDKVGQVRNVLRAGMVEVHVTTGIGLSGDEADGTSLPFRKQKRRLPP
jgi:hypothetical protein